MGVGTGQHRQQLHEVQRPHVAVEAPVGPLLQAELGDGGLELSGQPHRDQPGGLGGGERGVWLNVRSGIRVGLV